MIFAGPPKKFIQCLNACVGGLNLIPPDEWEGNLPARPYKGRNDQWVIGRGDKYFAVTADDQGRERFSLTPTGQLSIYIRVKRHQNSRTKQEESELAEYSLAFSNLSEGDARIASLRYDLDPGNATPQSPDWDAELKKNIAHPTFHLHVNFHLSEQANKVRLVLGQVSPILVLRNFGVWYAPATR